jgi:ribosomal protein S18 acetylase RimI-like enzyme
VTTIQYAQQRAWIGMVIVHPDFQRRGLGQAISEVAVDYLQAHGIREIMLSASDQGRPVYERIGFHKVCTMQIWLGEAQPQAVNPARRVRPDDLPWLIELDAAAFGVARPQPLTGYIHAFPTLGWCDGEPGEVAGFVLAQARDAGLIWITPWIHRAAEGAERLLKTALNALPVGRPVRVNITDYHTEAQRIAAEAGLRCSMETTRMIYDPDHTLSDVITHEYGTAFPAIG